MYKVTFIISDEDMLNCICNVSGILNYIGDFFYKCNFVDAYDKLIERIKFLSEYGIDLIAVDMAFRGLKVVRYENARNIALSRADVKLDLFIMMILTVSKVHMSSLHSFIETNEDLIKSKARNRLKNHIAEVERIAYEIRNVVFSGSDDFKVFSNGKVSEPLPNLEDVPSIAKVAKQSISSYIDKLVSKYNELKKEITSKDNKIVSLEEKVKELTFPKLTKKEELSKAFALVATETMNTNRGKPQKTRTEVSNALNVIEKRIKIDIDEGLVDNIDNYDADEIPPKIEIKELVLNKNVDKEANVSNGGIGFKTENKE